MQVAPPGGQNWNQFELHYMLAKFGTNSDGITWWSNFELIQVEPHQLAKFGTNASGILFSWRDNSCYRLYTPWVRCASGNVYYGSVYVTVGRGLTMMKITRLPVNSDIRFHPQCED